jgi:hypothetical protein
VRPSRRGVRRRKMSDPIRDAAVALRERFEDGVEKLLADPNVLDVRKVLASLNALEDVLGEPRTSAPDIFGTGGILAPATPSNTTNVRFDEFYGLAPLEAATRYLRKCPDARPFPEILGAVRAGGGTVNNEDELRTSLTRSTLDIVKIGDRFGAIEKYPHVKRSGKPKSRQPVILEEGTAGDGGSDTTGG